MLPHIQFFFQGITRLQAKGVGSVCGRLFFGTAEKIPESELIDTTGAGDAFIGAILYGMCVELSCMHESRCGKTGGVGSKSI